MMKYILAIALTLLPATVEARPRVRLFRGPFLIGRLTYRPQPIFGGPKMVWRGDWVPISELRR